MSTLGGYQDACGGYHEYTRECSVHWRDTIDTPGYSVHQRDTMSTLGDFGTNEKKPPRNFEVFCSWTFCDSEGVYVGLWNMRQLVKISLSGSQSRVRTAQGKT